jgi:putative CocE/NonD family hydrolase
VSLTFHEDGRLGLNEDADSDAVFDYISDPAKPVPYRSETEGFVFTPRPYMTDDQRHASKRPDVLTFETEALEDPVTLAGEIQAQLDVILSTTDADFVVKIIDVFPPDHPDFAHNPDNIEMGSYQMLVRAEVMRGRFRDDFSNPKPFRAGQETEVNFTLQDMLHTFKPGHKIMVQIHSTWFPYIDRNPQKYVDNIMEANAEDFIKSEIKVLGTSTVCVGKSNPKKVARP